MRSSSYAVLHLFIDKCSTEKQNRLKSYLPEEMVKEIDSIKPIAKETKTGDFSYKDFFNQVHYSWLIPTLETYTKTEQAFFLQALTGNIQEQLESIFTPTKTEISEIGKQFLSTLLFQSLVGESQSLLPKSALPKSDFQFLLDDSKDELVELIDYLSLYDLSLELRRIVETKILKRIYSFLSVDKREFLKKLMKYTEPFSLPKFAIPHNENEFCLAMHKRGLKRLAYAISSEYPDFIWYLSHHLDIGRGNALYKYSAKKAPEQLALACKKNIQEVSNWLMKER